jgi:hypothetical protein
VGRALYISAGLAVVGSVISWVTIRNGAAVETPTQPMAVSCQDQTIREPEVDEAA